VNRCVKVDANAAKARVNMHPQPLEQASSLEQAASAFVELRPRLFGIAYRMLGSAAEAEDVLQEAWLRWQNTDRSTIANPSAFLATATTRLAINALQSARVRRKTYIGPWLPEPVDTSADNAVARQPAVGPTWNSRRCGAAVSPQAASASELLTPTNPTISENLWRPIPSTTPPYLHPPNSALCMTPSRASSCALATRMRFSSSGRPFRAHVRTLPHPQSALCRRLLNELSCFARSTRPT
jgi:hypothetical protein